jgi:hypothetical protein
MVVSLARRFRYCVARCSFSSIVCSSSCRSFWTESKPPSSSSSSCWWPLRAPFVPLTGGELRPLSSESRPSASADELAVGDKGSQGDLESLPSEFLGLDGPLLVILAGVAEDRKQVGLNGGKPKDTLVTLPRYDLHCDRPCFLPSRSSLRHMSWPALGSLAFILLINSFQVLKSLL